MRAKEAKLIAIVDYLSSMGIKPLKETNQGIELWYSSPIREGDSDPSFKIDRQKNLWFDFGLSKGGNVLDLVISHQGLNVKQALAFLEKSNLYQGDTGNISYSKEKNGIFKQSTAEGGKTPHSTPLSLFDDLGQFKKDDRVGNLTTNDKEQKIAGEKEKISTFEILGVGEIKSASLLGYLSKRAINIPVAMKYLQQINYKPRGAKNEYFALGWKCGNGYEVRNPYFKGFVGTKKDVISVNLKENQTLSIFEGFMDFLAFLTYYDKKDFKNSVIILNSINLRKKALEKIELYHFSKVYLFLDNDRGGEETKLFFKESIRNIPIVDQSCLYSRYNDFNEMLIEENKCQQ